MTYSFWVLFTLNSSFVSVEKISAIYGILFKITGKKKKRFSNVFCEEPKVANSGLTVKSDAFKKNRVVTGSRRVLDYEVN